MADRHTTPAPGAEQDADTREAPADQRPAPDGALGEPVDAPAPADEKPLEVSPAVPPARVEPVVIPRWIQTIALAAVLLLLWAIVSAARSVVLIFVVAGVIALIVNPIEKNVLRGSGSLVKFGTGLITSVAQAALALVLTVVISVYMLVYSDRIGRVVRRAMPPGDGSPQDDFPLRVQKAVFGYVRGQLIFSFTMGFSAGVALWIFGAVGIFPAGQRYALFFGTFYGLMELVPFIGPVLGAIPPVLVALFQDPLTAVWVALLFLGLQQLEGHVVAPQVFGRALRINPLLVLLVLLVGGEVYGIVGALVALPIAAVIRETIVYMREHAVLEPWGTPSYVAVRDGKDPPAEDPES